MTRRRIRAGIIGAGLMGRMHAAAARRAGVDIAAISDPDLVRAQKLAASFGSCDALGIDQMLALGLEVIHVCTPPQQHFDTCQAALRARSHVLCEKPIAQNAAQVGVLLELAAAQAVQLCPVHQFPFQRGVKKLESNVTKLGTVRHVHAEICTAGGTGMDDERRHQVALDILPHPLSLFRVFAAGALEKVDWRVASPCPGELLVAGVR
ncbi:MAG TPA: Gfo/Idh/MocA family oxidoreductase, partial [Gemmatimonadaceae bacterium]|nr:Gfo/Idh/MocA family oxidoreductase [Gemmatimonadaceae bacterium]